MAFKAARTAGEPVSLEEQFGIVTAIVLPSRRARSLDHAWRSLKRAMRRYGTEPSALTAAELDVASRAMQEARRLARHTGR